MEGEGETGKEVRSYLQRPCRRLRMHLGRPRRIARSLHIWESISQSSDADQASRGARDGRESRVDPEESVQRIKKLAEANCERTALYKE